MNILIIIISILLLVIIGLCTWLRWYFSDPDWVEMDRTGDNYE